MALALGSLGSSLGDLALSPFVSGPLLLAVTYAPEPLRDAILSLARTFPQWYTRISKFDLGVASTALRVVFGLALVRVVNRVLNVAANNSWRLTVGKGWEWSKEIAVVTGGSSGIGKLLAERLASEGVRVAVLDIQGIPKSMEDGNSSRIRYFQCDVTSTESIAAAADAVRRELGHPSILINNAGIAHLCPLLEVPEATLRKVFAVNTISHWFTAQQFVPHMIEVNKGHVVTIASLASYIALPLAADYSATKASALAFHEALTTELRHQHGATNILTTVVHPNFVRTPLIAGFAGVLEKSGLKLLTIEQVVEPVIRQIKSRRGGQLVMPNDQYIVTSLRSWPAWLQQLFRDIISRKPKD
ncbi:hypothetical protein GGR50DRAFT_688913 [Xylaria sp. CBS 124048]|nr:hypothetical protein GGR50DRAFT_688913 [Xylaria sp. CBS 124048]